jgi:hypothetical protein
MGGTCVTDHEASASSNVMMRGSNSNFCNTALAATESVGETMAPRSIEAVSLFNAGEASGSGAGKLQDVSKGNDRSFSRAAATARQSADFLRSFSETTETQADSC